MDSKYWSTCLAMLLVGAMVAGCLPAPATGPRPLPIQAPPPPLTRLDGELTALRGPIPFPIEANVGQAASEAAYLVRIGDLHVGFEAGGLTYALRATEPSQTAELSGGGRPDVAGSDRTRRWTVRQELVGAQPATPVGTIAAQTEVSYFVGPSEASPVGVPAFHQVAYPAIWPGITVTYQRAGPGLKSSFHLDPGADPGHIRLAYHGGRARIGEDGVLHVDTPLGLLRESAPVAWQDGRTGREPVTVRWVLRAGPDGDTDAVGFQLGPYDSSRPLVIDPLLTYATYLGGGSADTSTSVALDASGSVYLTGNTESTQATFPTGGGFVGTPGFDQTFNGGRDAFVVKVNPSGTGLVYAAFVGGVNDEMGTGIAVDAAGSAYLTGSTESSAASFLGGGFLFLPGFDKVHNGGEDAFVVKLDPSGTGIVYATYIGGSSTDTGTGIAVDASGSAYVVGYTTSSVTTFPDGDPNGNDQMDVPGFDQSHNGMSDGFVVKLSPAGTGLVYATYIGGAALDQAYGIAVDAGGSAYVTGLAASTQTTFPDGDPNGNDLMEVPGFDQFQNGDDDAFVVKLNAAGTGLAYATYVGGNDVDRGVGIAVDASGSAYVTGVARSTQMSFPFGGGFLGVPGFDQTHNGDYDAFVVKLNAAGTGLAYATFLGGDGQEGGTSIALDAGGSASVAGYTTSTQATFPDGDPNGNDLMDVPGFDQTQNGGFDAFVVKLNAVGTGLAYATYIGGSGTEEALDIAVDASGGAYVVGYTASTEATFPDGDPNGNDLMDVPGFDQNHNGGGMTGDAWVAQLGVTATPTPTSTSTPTAVPGATPTATSTSTPTGVPTATPGLCAPRPTIRVVTAAGGAGRLNATLQAQVLPATPVNALTSVRVTALTNAQVSLNGGTLAAGPAIPLPPGTQQITVVVQQLVPGQAATAHLMVTDACGTWPTFVGGGPSAF